VARRIPLPSLRWRAGRAAAEAVVVAVPRLPLPGVADRGHGAAGYPHPVAPVVLGGVPAEHRDAGDLRGAAAAPAGHRALRDRLDDAAEAAAGDGQPEAAAAHRSGRGGRVLRRRPGPRAARWSPARHQGAGRGGRGDARCRLRAGAHAGHRGRLDRHAGRLCLRCRRNQAAWCTPTAGMPTEG
jgi:hypothetical protein